MTERALRALRLWRGFADSTEVLWNGERRSWRDHISGNGYVDEERLVQPIVFPRFAQELLGFAPSDLAAEVNDGAGKPDFTPADLVTHPFVFETKGTRDGSALQGYDEQVHGYLTRGRNRIRRVLLMNLVGARVFALDGAGGLIQEYEVDLRGLLSGAESAAATTHMAGRLADILDEFRHQDLTLPEKLERVRRAPQWNPAIEATSPDWLLQRVRSVVERLNQNVRTTVAGGGLADPARTDPGERAAAVEEMRVLAGRLGADDPSAADLDAFLDASPDSDLGKALAQYEAHVAYYAATRLLLVRIWEDLGLLQPMLYDGGFDTQMQRFDNLVRDVVAHSFTRAGDRYRSLFTQHASYGWYVPDEVTYGEVIYELGTTYLGAIESDVLGRVYEQLLAHIDRKLLGQYYTPRDVIELVWDLIGLDAVADHAESEDRVPRVLDIATGSGGFLVHAAAALRRRLAQAQQAGATIRTQDWLNGMAEGLVGVEVQRFSAYLAELNLLVQLGHVVAQQPDLRLPPLGVLSADTLALHDPDGLHACTVELGSALLTDGAEARRRAAVVVNATQEGGTPFDVACGNPPYVGQKVAAALIDRTRREHPYWEQHVGHHMDYLYWFIVLGISKLRPGGRFGFVTTEYWLRAVGAAPLRAYLAQHCDIDRLVLLRDFRPFKDAPGQHTLLVAGSRRTGPGPTSTKPTVSVYEAARMDPAQRRQVLGAVRRGASAYGVRTFRGAASPGALGAGSWSEATLDRAQLARRRALRGSAPVLALDPVQGVLSSANRMRTDYARTLPTETLTSIGWPTSKHGIFVLTDQETRALGTLTPTETSALRTFVNTVDVLPYAAVPPPDGDRLLYLPAADGDTRQSCFPQDMPAFHRHLQRFRPLLDRKVEQYGEDRPWWSLHRPRHEILARATGTGPWSDYALTPNWGGGGRLTVGLAPRGSVPAQGLNALLSPPGVPGAYVSAVLNSTVVQQLVSTLPPGYLRRADFQELGAPLGPPETVRLVAALGLRLADTVRTLAGLSRRFPELLPSLLRDVALADDPAGEWTPKTGPATTTGTVASVSWINEAERRAVGVHRIARVETGEDLRGLVVTAHGPLDSGAYIAFGLPDGEHAAATALAAMLRGAGRRAGRLRDIASMPVAISPARLAASHEADVHELTTVTDDYRGLRGQVDELLAAFL